MNYSDRGRQQHPWKLTYSAVSDRHNRHSGTSLFSCHNIRAAKFTRFSHEKRILGPLLLLLLLQLWCR